MHSRSWPTDAAIAGLLIVGLVCLLALGSERQAHPLTPSRSAAAQSPARQTGLPDEPVEAMRSGDRAGGVERQLSGS